MIIFEFRINIIKHQIILCIIISIVYIGSTIENLQKRLKLHKKDYKNFLKNKHHYISSYKIAI